MSGPLSGLRIADFTQFYQGPLATQMLADMGADVIKIEPPNGDFFRRWSLGDRFPEGESTSFLTVNRNKRSIVLDLKQAAALEVARAIVKRSDVVIENFRPGVMDRLGLGYDALVAHQPGIIYCASTGYGATGPYRDYPGQDLLVQAIGGTMWLNGRRDDPPTAIGFGIADVSGGLHIVIGVLAAVHERNTSGRGQRVDVSLLNSLFHVQTHELAYFANSGDEPIRPRANTTAAYTGAPLGVYATRDGYIAVAMMPIGVLARLVGVEELALETSANEIPRRDEVHGRLEAAFRSRANADWLDLLRGSDIWCAPVQTLQGALDDPQVGWNELIREIEHPIVGRLKVIAPPIGFGRTPPEIRIPPPLLGQHSAEILAELGYGEAIATQLISSGAVRQDDRLNTSTPAYPTSAGQAAGSPVPQSAQ